MESAANDIINLSTEARNPRSANIDQVAASDLCKIINDEDATVAGVVGQCIPTIAAAINALTERIGRGGRVVYVGAGTSGRLGVLDASEIPPTFSAPTGQFVALIAGGDAAIRMAQEGAEDSRDAAVEDLQALQLDGCVDSLIAIASSGRTPYVLSSLAFAKTQGCMTIGITCTAPSAMSRSENVDFLVEAVTGAEVVTGSTRMKAGTATKLVLNMLSTGVMVNSGKTFGNIMVDVRPTNVKLQHRARRILREIAPTASLRSDMELDEILSASSKSVKVAALVLSLGITVKEAEEKLQVNRGVLAKSMTGARIDSVEGEAGDLCEAEFVVCVDGGGSKCRAVVISRDGSKGAGEAGPCNVTDIGVTAAISEIQLAMKRALVVFPRTKGRKISSLRFLMAWIGLSGGDRKDSSNRIAKEMTNLLNLQYLKSVHITNDLEMLAKVAALTDSVKDIVVVVAGTGSIAVHFRQENGDFQKVARAGGWGALLGDDGSGFDIGRQALRYTLERLDGPAGDSAACSKADPVDPLADIVLTHYRKTYAQEAEYDLLSTVLMSATGNVQTTSEAKCKIASSAKAIIQSTESSRQAAPIIHSAQQSLTRLVSCIIDKSNLVATKTGLVLAGGLMMSELFQNGLKRELATQGLSFKFVRHLAQPADDGARFLAQNSF